MRDLKYEWGSLNHFRIARYRVTIIAKDHLNLPIYKGSTLRGGFGAAFRRICCSNRGSGLRVGETCNGCILHETCPYGYIFETSPPPGSEALRNYESVPRPFVLEPPLDLKTHYEPGEALDFGLVLVGRTIQYFPYFVVAFRELGEVGIGKGRGRFQLHRIVAFPSEPRVQSADNPSGSEIEVYEGTSGHVRQVDPTITGEDILREAEKLVVLTGGSRNGACGESGNLSVHFRTMTRLKFENQLNPRPEFHVLVRNLLRRASALSYFHHGAPLEVDYRGIIERAQEVELVHDETHWVDWERYSSRQDTRMTFGGIVGRAVYGGEVSAFTPLLMLGQYVHLGKNVTFGLGKYQLCILDEGV